MKNIFENKRWSRPVIAFLLVFCVLSGVYLLYMDRAVTLKKEQGLAIASSETSTIRDRFDVALARAYSLRDLIVSDYGSTEGFDEVADLIYQETSKSSGISLKNLAVAPDGVVQKVYPLEGNEGLIGFDFMDITREGNQEAVEAYQKGKLVVTNPFTLVQGGVGMGGRLPVFIESGGTQKFWGLVTVTLDYEALLEDLNLNELVKGGYYYQLWYEGEDGNPVTLAESKEKVSNPVTETFSLSNLEWNLSLSPTSGWHRYLEELVVFLAILGFSLLMALFQMDKMQIQIANEKLERLAQMDALTSCYSRQYVNTILVNQRTGQWNDPALRYSLAMVDLDCFKTINDTYGHETGDRALVAASQLLLDNCRTANGDCVIRHGGDEFIILFNDVTRERFISKLQTILEQMRGIRFEDLPALQITVSIGGDYYISAEESTYYAQVHRADEQLYRAKALGKNQYQV